MSTTKLDWDYQDRSRTPEYRAEYKGLVIRAIHDDSPSNPFTEDDGHWPMLALPCGRYERVTEYDDVPGLALGAVLGRFNDAALIHDQKAIGAAVEVTDSDFESHLEDGQTMRRWWTDVTLLRLAFEDALTYLSDNKRLEALAELYGLLGIPCLHTTVHGYCQGDQTDLLIVATPEAQEKLRGKDWAPTDAEREQALKDDMEGQAKLYKAWAFGDVYGYQLARKVTTTHCCDCDHVHEGEIAACPGCASDDIYEEAELVDIEEPDAACWSYYGSEFDESGLEEAAMDAAEGYVTENA